ncbi:hypothetical protein EJB05_17160, partial [Eragrostis curvula]
MGRECPLPQRRMRRPCPLRPRLLTYLLRADTELIPCDRLWISALSKPEMMFATKKDPSSSSASSIAIDASSGCTSGFVLPNAITLKKKAYTLGCTEFGKEKGVTTDLIIGHLRHRSVPGSIEQHRMVCDVSPLGLLDDGLNPQQHAEKPLQISVITPWREVTAYPLIITDMLNKSAFAHSWRTNYRKHLQRFYAWRLWLQQEADDLLHLCLAAKHALLQIQPITLKSHVDPSGREAEVLSWTEFGQGKGLLEHPFVSDVPPLGLLHNGLDTQQNTAKALQALLHALLPLVHMMRCKSAEGDVAHQAPDVDGVATAEVRQAGRGGPAPHTRSARSPGAPAPALSASSSARPARQSRTGSSARGRIRRRDHREIVRPPTPMKPAGIVERNGGTV